MCGWGFRRSTGGPKDCTAWRGGVGRGDAGAVVEGVGEGAVDDARRGRRGRRGGGGGPGIGGPGDGFGGGGGFGGNDPGPATVYPDGIAMAATGDTDLIHGIASDISDEARAKYDPSGGAGRGRGLSLWCPNLNLARDPRWGRTEETFGEDPYLAGRLAVSYVKGLQGDDPKYLKTAATPKHFAGYNVEANRTAQNSEISERALREYYLAPFEAAIVEGKAASIMSAYNSINGIPCTANPWLLTDVLRGEWGFQGATVCDSRAVSNIYSAHGYVDSEEKAAAAAINAGLDIFNDGNQSSSTIVDGVEAGLISEKTLDQAVTSNLLVRFRLGMFDPPEMLPFKITPESAVGSQQHLARSLLAACEATVLLKNDPAPKGHGFEKLLPLDLRRVSSIAVLGPYADLRQFGSYNGSGVGPSPTPLEALQEAVGERVAVRTSEYRGDSDDAIKLAESSDVTIVVAGLNNVVERASTDRYTLDLPSGQEEFIEKIVKANPATILVLEGGSAMNLAWAKEHVPAILVIWYPGEEGGDALAQTVLGKSNPAGRLPLTFYRSTADLPAMDDFYLSKGRTYMYMDKPPTYAFGHGLSYTSFGYSNLRFLPSTSADMAFTAAVDVANTGPCDGDEVVQLYASKADSTITRPGKQLAAFQRIHIPQGQTRTVLLDVTARSVSYWEAENHAFAIEPGAYQIGVGAASDDLRVRGSVMLK